MTNFIGVKYGIMGDQRIRTTQCRGTLQRAKQIAGDPKIATYPDLSLYNDYLSGCKKVVVSILQYAIKHSYLTKKQIEVIERMHRNYQKIVELNQGFDEGFVNTAVSLLEDLATIVESHIGLAEDKTRKGQRCAATNIRNRAEHIGSGKYFWGYHIEFVEHLLPEKRNDNSVRDLEQRLSELKQKVFVELEKNLGY